jgi:hypothetical protein
MGLGNPTWEQEEWLEVLMRVARHDSYHLPLYQRVEEFRLGATAHRPFLIASPLLLRPTEEVLGRWHDATSAYGYGAPIASRDDLPSSFVSKAGKQSRRRLTEDGRRKTAPQRGA